MNVTALQSREILTIPLHEPERLFSKGDLDSCKAEFQILAKRWHPDRESGSADVMAHINQLYDNAKEHIAKGVWRTPNVFEITTTDRHTYRMRYHVARPFELGDVYIGSHLVAYYIRKDFEDLATSADHIIHRLRFASDAMRAEVIRYLPSWKGAYETADGRVVVLQKSPDHLPLRDVLTHLGGRLDPRHVAWVMSRLCNLACYLEWAEIVHGDISIDNYFISPSGHVGSLIGGWWYARYAGTKLVALPRRTMDTISTKVLAAKIADFSIDLEMVRATGRELLGDPAGSRLQTMSDVPRPFANWLRLPPAGTAVATYKDWYDKVVLDSFGPRKFVELNVSAGDIFKEK